MYKKSLLVILLLVLVALVATGFYFFQFRKDNQFAGSNTEQQTQLQVEKTEFVGTQFPAAIPKDLPIEAGSTILENYESKTNDGRIQSTVTLSVSSSLTNTFNTYLRFFKDKHWLEIEPLRNVTAEKATTVLQYQAKRLMLEVTNDTNTNQRRVKLVLLESSKE
jgi:hypothetical protein